MASGTSANTVVYASAAAAWNRRSSRKRCHRKRPKLMARARSRARSIHRLSVSKGSIGGRVPDAECWQDSHTGGYTTRRSGHDGRDSGAVLQPGRFGGTAGAPDRAGHWRSAGHDRAAAHGAAGGRGDPDRADRKSTRLNSSHSQISYAVFFLKKKNYGTSMTD